MIRFLQRLSTLWKPAYSDSGVSWAILRAWWPATDALAFGPQRLSEAGGEHPFGCEEFATVAVGNRPSSLAVDSDMGRIYVATADDDAVSVIDGATNTIVATISVAATP
jgi:YVTN family beta-propeller protein